MDERKFLISKDKRKDKETATVSSQASKFNKRSKQLSQGVALTPGIEVSKPFKLSMKQESLMSEEDQKSVARQKEAEDKIK